MEINWTVLAYILVGLFVMSGFFKGWWKEAITTFFLGVLIFLLNVPVAAQGFIDLINLILETIWEFLPDFVNAGPLIQLDATSGGTWLTILLLFIGLAIFISRASLSSRMYFPFTLPYPVYGVTPLGSLLGGLLGGLNGFLIINLIREYLDGRKLPDTRPATEIAMAAGDSLGIASSGVAIQFADLPRFTIFNAFLPWLIIAFGILIFILTFRSRRTLWGYITIDITKKDKEIVVKVETKLEGKTEVIEIKLIEIKLGG